MGLWLWLRFRHAGAVLGGFLFIAAVTSTLQRVTFQSGEVEPVTVQAVMFGPALVILVLAIVGDTEVPLVDRSSSRRLGLYQLLLDLLLVGVACLCLMVSVSTTDLKTAILRNIIGLAGISWLTGAFSKRVYGPALPLLLVIALTSLGRTPATVSLAWLWMLPDNAAPTTQPSSWMIAISLFVTGLFVAARHQNRN